MYILLCDHFEVIVCISCYVITLGLRSKYDVMVTISDSRCKSLRLRLVGCIFDIVYYDVMTVATLPHTAIVLYANI